MKTGRILGLATLLVAIAIPADAETGEHCAYTLVPIAREGAVMSADLELIGCYPTYAEALEAGTGGTLEVSAEVSPATITDAQSEVSAASSVLIGTEYDDTGYSGSSISYFAPRTCSASTTWEVAWVGATWNDRFESGKGFGSCDTNKKFQNVDFGGAARTCTPNCTSYQGLANQVSSLRWKD